MPGSVSFNSSLVTDAVSRSSGASGSATTIADVTRQEWQRFLEFYRPLEEEVLAKATQTDFTTEGNIASETAANSIKASQGTLARRLRSQGVELSADERAALNRRVGTTLTRSRARAENTTRRNLSDERTNILADIVGIGRGVAQSARGGLNTAADMEAQRNQAYAIDKAQYQGQLLSGLGTAASLAIAFL